ncbi:MAG: 4Fe-4S dicluster domain-containing protein [Candidatus Omnitrophica bacterium]|nr:4Fe-4S dicluster domain-containing protein [Candidatus Omnitrophota bacterium]
MCEFCVKHGEGKKWYLNAKNYSDDLLIDIKRHKFTEDFFYWISGMYNSYYGILKSLPFRSPVLGKILNWSLKRYFLYKHWGQVIPIEDVQKILNITNSITRIPCICRMTTTGKESRVCFLLSINPEKVRPIDIVDKSFFKGPDVSRFEAVGREWTINFMKEQESKGSIHTIWSFNAPFVAALCNCAFSKGCIAMMMYKKIAPVMFRAEYIAFVNTALCIGCQECKKICQFNAVKIDKASKKASIDIKKCYGCGVCRSVCKNKSISLKDRYSEAAAANLW